MKVMISEKTQTEGSTKKTGDDKDEDREMKECFVRLNAWQAENLMAPHGMDQFAESSGKTKSGTIIKGK